MKQHWHYQQKQHHQQIGFWVVTSPVTVIKKNKDGSDEKWFSSVTVKSVQPKNGDKRCNLEPFTPKQRDSAPIWSHCPILVTKSSCNLCQSHKMSCTTLHTSQQNKESESLLPNNEDLGYMYEELIGEVTACREQRQNTRGVARCYILPEAFVPLCFLRCLLCITVCLGNKWDRGVVRRPISVGQRV